MTKDGFNISFKYGPYSKEYEKAMGFYKASKILGIDVFISKANEFDGGKDSVFLLILNLMGFIISLQ